MKLGQYISQNPDAFIYVGSKSAFVYCGVASKSDEYLKEASKKHYKLFANSLHEAEVKLKHLPARIKKSEKEIIDLQNGMPIVRRHICVLEENHKKYIALHWVENLDPEGEMDEKHIWFDAEIKRYTRMLKQMGHTLELTVKRLAEQKKDLERLPNTIANYKRIIDGWQDFLDRKVIDSYPRKMVKPYGTIVLMEGEEEGKYWDYAEWLHDNKTFDEEYLAYEQSN